ncbi:MAG: phospholipase, partial [Actinobacteria bacterium]|nr:phospholipase [Actinomycetota bacterium]
MLALTAATALAADPLARAAAAAAPARLPAPEHSGLDHVVLVTMENRSFDHILGWLQGADGKQAGLTYLDANGTPHSTFPLAPDLQGCAYKDPDHEYAGARAEWNNGACDGWLKASDLWSIGYYRQQ